MGFRALQHHSGPLAVLANWSDETEIEISFSGEYESVREMLRDFPVKVNRRRQSTYAELALPARTAAVVNANAD